MAVQAEYGTSSFEPDYCTRGVVVRTNQTEVLPACTDLLGYNNNNCNNMNIMKKLSFEETPQRSELTYNASTSLVKKRARDNAFMAFQFPPTFSSVDVPFSGVPTTQRAPIHPVPVMGSAQRPLKQARLMDSGFGPFGSMASGSNFLRPLPVCGNANLEVPPVNPGYSTLRGVVTGRTNVNQARLVGSGSPSTSGRPALSGSKSTGIENELESIFQQLSADTEKIFDLELQKIRLAVEEQRKVFYGAIMSEISKSPAMQLLVQKEAELENSTKRTAELELRLKLLSGENQAWVNIARNNESIVMKLRSKMEQSLKNGYEKNVLEEGMGDTDEVQSTCRDDVPVNLFVCRVCRKKDAGRLVFPCRHLCICDGCDAVVSTCPVCSQPKLSTIPVLFS